MRKLVSIRKVAKLLPIEKADRIEIAQVDGWQTIVKKGEFTEGDLCVFFEIDSFLPVEDRYKFLGKPTKWGKQEGYRIKTMKMRGVLSQGLSLPLKIFPELTNVKLGDEVTKKLKVQKWEPINYRRYSNGSTRTGKPKRFPNCIPKTDQERIQNLLNYFKLHKEVYFEETLKLDGSSMTVGNILDNRPWYKKLGGFIKTGKWPKYRICVCSRNLELTNDKPIKVTFKNMGKESVFESNEFLKVAKRDKIMEKIPPNYAVQGELISPKIQANHEKVDDSQFWIFDVIDTRTKQHLPAAERYRLLKKWGLMDQHVPIVNTRIQIFKECDTLEKLLERVEGESMNPGTVSEGRVYKEIYGRFSFKAINNQYLLTKK